MKEANDFLTMVIKKRLKDFESGSFMQTVIRCPICDEYVNLRREKAEGPKDNDNWVFHCPKCEMFNYILPITSSDLNIAWGAIETCILKLREVRYERSKNSDRS